MTPRYSTILFFLVLCAIILPAKTNALNILSIIPPNRVVTILPGGASTQEVIFGRTDASRSERLTVTFYSSSSRPGVRFRGETSFTLLQGEKQKIYRYTIHGQNAMIGTYNHRLTFTTSPSLTSTGGNAVQFAIAQQVTIHVVETLPIETKILDASKDMIELDRFISSSPIRHDTKKSSDGESVAVSWEVTNTSDQAIKNIPFILTIRDLAGRTKHTDQDAVTQTLFPQEKTPVVRYLPQLSPGRYTVKLVLGSSQTETTIILLPPQKNIIFWRTVLVSGVLFFLGFLGLMLASYR
ncbi:hypothetical protein FJZ48_01280 [Candidatus Uhrbacteria bacterium]|nr:hypothetical protein [Candidatus Uhrbacteria bacterium]